MSALHVPLSDGDLRLELLVEGHREGLRDACAQDLAVWEIYPTSYAPDHFDTAFDTLIGSERLCFALFDGGDLVGMSAYFGVDPVRNLLEIGNSYIAPSVRGTGFNGRLKRLMISHAFACGFRRIELRVDVRNTRSMAAVKKIGGVFEGIMRAERITWTGHVRDTALFSILAGEWPARA